MWSSAASAFWFWSTFAGPPEDQPASRFANEIKKFAMPVRSRNAPKTMSHSAAYSILAAIVVGLVNFFLTRMRDAEEKSAKTTVRAIGGALADSGRSAVDSLEAGAKGAITVAVACAMAGIIAGCITVTGLASILINAIVQLAGNATFIGLILTMVCCIILGMGVPTTANYCIMALTATCA